MMSSKRHFFRCGVQYIGHVLKGCKRYPSPAKTEALNNCNYSAINKAKKMKCFLGLVGWYQIDSQDLLAPKSVVNLPTEPRRIKLTPREAEKTWTQAMIDCFTHPKSTLSQR